MLDTLKYSKHLQSAGVSQAQANAQAEALRDAVAESVATKAQLENVEQRLSAEFMQVSADIKAMRWAFGLLLGLVMTVLGMTTATLVKLLI